MYISLNIDITLDEEQKESIRKQVEEQLTSAVKEDQIKNAVQEVCKGMIKSVVNECIQTKEYRAYISGKIMKMLTMKEED